MEDKVMRFDDGADSSKVWEWLIKDVKACNNELSLQQLVTRHVRDSYAEGKLRGLVRGVFFFVRRDEFCQRCGKEHWRLILTDDVAGTALDVFYYELQVTFSAWVNKQSQKFQQGLHSAADSISMTPPLKNIMSERHKGAWHE